jgi:hypothetical protein
MKKVRVVLYIVFLVFVAITIFMGLNIDKMIGQFGLLSFLRFFQGWLTYGNLFFIVLLITENIYIWFLKRAARYAEEERDDLIIRVNDLRRQVNEMKKQNKESE